MEVIQKEQTATEVFVLQLEAGARPPRRALKAINRDRKIQELKEHFDTNKITLYVQGMSAHTDVVLLLYCCCIAVVLLLYCCCITVVLLLYFIVNKFKTFCKSRRNATF